MVHRGFYEGAKAHAEDIVQYVNEAMAAYGRKVPVWVTGHSLGGGYANCLILHMLAQRQGAKLFSAGAGPAAFLHAELSVCWCRQLLPLAVCL